MKLRRVAVTGIGCVNALGKNISEFWGNAKSGQIGIAPIQSFDTETFRVKVAAEIKNFDPVEYLPVKTVRQTERFTQLAMIAAREAVEEFLPVHGAGESLLCWCVRQFRHRRIEPYFKRDACLS